MNKIKSSKRGLFNLWRSRPFRLALSALMLTLSVIMLSGVLGVDERGNTGLREARGSVVQSLALQLSTVTLVGNTSDVADALRQFVSSNDDVVAASVAQPNGFSIASVGSSAELSLVKDKSTITHLRVPVFKGDSRWGNVDVVFKPTSEWLSTLIWYAFIALGCFTAYILFFKRALVQLDPSRAVPGRVDSAFNLFNEGVIILDDHQNIVMANSAAGKLVSTSSDNLVGKTLDSWPWVKDENWKSPWAETLMSGNPIVDKPLRLTLPDGSTGVFVTSCSPVGNNEEKRGVLVTLDDMTVYERQNIELEKKETALLKLNDSLQVKNQELEVLATRDSLSGLYNRRVLMENMDREFQRAKRENTPLSVVMADIDFFKKINDNYGHGVGDDVIKAVAGVMDVMSREYDTVGRYGGEEFMMVVPGQNAVEAKKVAERIRIAVTELPEKEQLPVSELSASFGVAELNTDAETEADFIDFADQALYVAKQQGRNQVVIFSKTMKKNESSEGQSEKANEAEKDSDQVVESFKRIKQLESLVKQRTSDLEKYKLHDTLTGVPLRTLFLQQVEVEIERCTRADKSVGVLSFEINDIERLISTFGHSATEALVVEFVARLHNGLRDTDKVAEITTDHNLSRITNNEYGVLLSDMHAPENAMPVITRLRRLLSQPFLVGEDKVYLGTSIGIAVLTKNGESADRLLENATAERVKASKSPDKVSHSFASESMDKQARTYLRLESELYDAVHNQELEVFYQPKFDLASQVITGVEALARWRNADGGFTSPEDFIPMAEANGLIVELYDFVLAESLSQIKRWDDINHSDLSVAVNISAVQLRDPNLVDKTLQALRQAHVKPHQLEIELTETAIIDNREQANKTLHDFRDNGIKVSMDDFGIGYTSLALLADLPIDTVKIDRSFIVTMESSERRQAIVESIVKMAKALNLTVVGEGIETASQLDKLDQIGCELIQGYYISKPLPKDDLVSFLVQQGAEHAKRSA